MTTYKWFIRHRDTLRRYFCKGFLANKHIGKESFSKEAFWQMNFLQISISQGELSQMGIFANR